MVFGRQSSVEETFAVGRKDRLVDREYETRTIKETQKLIEINLILDFILQLKARISLKSLVT